ncbi:MAG TPA: response regulator [Caulobacteraceae bacterium]|nr:response regulator [Caulobacteraceae bacterium]
MLIVDDDADLGRNIAAYLSRHGFSIEVAADGRTMDRALAAGSFEIIILDVMMPGEDGLSICRRLSAADAPAIIIMSAKGEDIDRIVGLELGADDYLPKPCNPRELLARIRAVLRRRELNRNQRPASSGAYRFAGYEFEPVLSRLRNRSGMTILLTRGERAILLALLDRPGQVLSREELSELTQSDYTDALDRAIDVQISRLRRKLGDSGEQEIIRTVRGLGYRFAALVTR